MEKNPQSYYLHFPPGNGSFLTWPGTLWIHFSATFYTKQLDCDSREKTTLLPFGCSGCAVKGSFRGGMNQMHSSQNILGIKAFLEVVLRGFCETYGAQGQMNPAADGLTENGASPWDGGLCLAGAHPCKALPSPGASMGNHRYFIPMNKRKNIYALFSSLFLRVFKLPSLTAWSFPDISPAGVVLGDIPLFAAKLHILAMDFVVTFPGSVQKTTICGTWQYTLVGMVVFG